MVIASPADAPTATLSVAVVNAYKVLSPSPVLFEPVVQVPKESVPMATFLPVVLFVKAFAPMATE